MNEDQANLRDTLKGLLAEIKIARTDIRELKSKQLGDSHKFERKDRLLPLTVYPEYPCTDNIYQIALASLFALGCHIEKKHPVFVREEEYNLELFNSSKAIASQYQLSAQQHFEILIQVLPAYSNSGLILKNTRNIHELFDLLSTSCSKFETVEGLEQKYTLWKPDFSSVEGLKTSLWDLLALEYKRDTMNATGLNALFKSIITKLRQCDIPLEAKAKLVNFLKIIHMEDMGINELFSRVLGILCANFPEQKTNKRYPQVHTVEVVKTNQKYPEKQQYKKQSNDRYKNTYNPGDIFVKPWDSKIPYHNSKSANGLSKSINDHFRDFCYKCGHRSHKAKDCKIYNGPIVMDLCSKCYQGFHEKCKSKRKDLLENKQKSFKTESSMQYPMFPPMFPYWPMAIS